VDVAIEYKLLDKEGKWLVYDVITDEQSHGGELPAEFSKNHQQGILDAFSKRMKKKLEEKND